MKNAWVAAILNFFLFGAGTLYVGRRPMVGPLLVTLGGTAIQVLEISLSPPFQNWASWPLLFVPLVIVKIGLAIDGYLDAKLTR